MIPERKDLSEAIFNVIQTAHHLECHDTALLSALEANKHGHRVEDVESSTRDALLQKLKNYQKELVKLLESAKATIIDGFSIEEDSLLNILDGLEIFDPEAIQEYYITEVICDSANIVERSREVRPLYLRQSLPSAAKKKYREAVLCYLSGRYDSCCIMCRSVAEMMIRELCRFKFKDKIEPKKYSFNELVDRLSRWGILKGKDYMLAKKIKHSGNDSVHSDKLANKSDAMESIKDTRNFLRSSLWEKVIVGN